MPRVLMFRERHGSEGLCLSHTVFGGISLISRSETHQALVSCVSHFSNEIQKSLIRKEFHLSLQISDKGAQDMAVFSYLCARYVVGFCISFIGPAGLLRLFQEGVVKG